eukprot:270870-Rhodomonas_salina.1
MRSAVAGRAQKNIAIPRNPVPVPTPPGHVPVTSRSRPALHGTRSRPAHFVLCTARSHAPPLRTARSHVTSRARPGHGRDTTAE